MREACWQEKFGQGDFSLLLTLFNSGIHNCAFSRVANLL